MTASMVPDCDSSGVIATSFSVTLLGDRERLEWFAFPQVVVDCSD
jgi:hypothetical protein